MSSMYQFGHNNEVRGFAISGNKWRSFGDLRVHTAKNVVVGSTTVISMEEMRSLIRVMRINIKGFRNSDPYCVYDEKWERWEYENL